jgi:DNA-binding response OmpR family regulator
MIAFGDIVADLHEARIRRPQLRLTPVRVLLADDDEDLGMFIANLLGVRGYDVRTVPNGFELVSVLSDWILGKRGGPPADIMIADVRMPGFDGLSVVESMCRSNCTMPTVLVSAVPRAELRLESVERRGVLFVPKPICFPELDRAVRSLLPH